jgi:hypothetical protein
MAQALALLEQMIALSAHQFWPDAIAPAQAPTLSSLALVGHRQVRDAAVGGGHWLAVKLGMMPGTRYC